MLISKPESCLVIIIFISLTFYLILAFLSIIYEGLGIFNKIRYLALVTLIITPTLLLLIADENIFSKALFMIIIFVICFTLLITFISYLVLISIMISLMISSITTTSIVFGFYIIGIAYLMPQYVFLFRKARNFLYWQFVPIFPFRF